MSSFTERLTVTQVSGTHFKTDREFSFYSDLNERGIMIDVVTVPKGFISDFATIPWPASMLIPKSGLYNQAAVLHDYLYWIQIFSRYKSDLFFLRGMEVLNVNEFKRKLMYSQVRMWGWKYWNFREIQISEGKKDVEI